MQTIFLELYLTVVLKSREKPPKALSEAFHPILEHIVQDEFRKIMVPTSIKMLKHELELALEVVCLLLKLKKLNLRKYVGDILPMVL